VIGKQSFTCSNPSCGKVFANPLKAENLGEKNAQVYNACPYCLTEIVVEESSLIDEEQKSEQKRIQPEQVSEQLTEEKPVHSSPTVVKCSHQLGYLSKRSPKEKIPEECMMCSKIVECMLKNVTG
jgi:hypothetical protein